MGRMTGRSAGRLAIGLLLTLGIIFLGVGVFTGYDSYSYVHSAERADGVVVDLKWELGTSSGTGRHRGTAEESARAVVSFRTAEGKRIVFEDSTSSKPPAYDLGETVEVLYPADDPQDARINGFVSLWLLPLIFGGLGLLLTAIGLIVLVVLRRKRRRKSLSVGAPFAPPAL